MSEALTMALYMIVCKEMGEIPKFPGNKFFYNSSDDCSYAGGLADISVWAATQEHTKNEAFNHVNGDTFVWRYFFQRLGQYFGIDVSCLSYNGSANHADLRRYLRRMSGMPSVTTVCTPITLR